MIFVRKVEVLSGAPRVRVACRPVGQYGEQELTRRRSNHLAFLGLEEEICFTTSIPLTYVLDEEDFVLNETKYLVLTYGAPLAAASLGEAIAEFKLALIPTTLAC